VLVYFTDSQEKDNERRIAVANESQNMRHFDPFYYSKMFRQLVAFNYTRCPFPSPRQEFRYAEGFCRGALDMGEFQKNLKNEAQDYVLSYDRRRQLC
jgi:hypothetical protein